MLDCPAYQEANANFGSVTMEGRKPGLTLQRDGAPITLQAWADELMGDIETVGRRLDEIRGGDEHARAIAAQREKLADPERTPSARVLRTMREHGQSFLGFALAQSEAHAAHFRAHPPSAETLRTEQALAAKSLAEQAELEAKEAGSFDAFVAAYRAYTLNRFSV
ncbi:Glutamate--cysteine ligase [Burkholderia cepacia]|nr:Glutamate--cysteine ligase [Burkholderia cepacia]